jgi:PAS domain S-box-containing protein
VESEPFDVVLVDDAEEVRAIVARHLQVSGQFSVVGEGSTGEEAIRLAGRYHPSVMILDVSMPVMDGLEALPRVLDASPATRVVMLSGFSGTALEATARGLGAADFVEKSTPVRELPGRLLRLLESVEEPVPTGDHAPAGADESELVLAAHLERFRTVFDQAAIGMATMTLSGTIVRANQALERLTGESEWALAGRPFAALAGPDTVDAVHDAVAAVTGGVSDVADVEHSLVAPGAGLWVHSIFTPVRDSEGMPLYLFAQVEDVTDRRQAWGELQASEERFRLLVEGVAEYAIFMLDRNGRVTTWNTGAERMKGYSADEILGEHFRRFYTPEDRDAGHPEYELGLALRDGRYEEEGWRLRKDGSRFWANVVITALFDHNGNHVGFGKVTRDVTERRLVTEASDRAAAELADMNRRLHAANEETADFLAMTTHELQSPITAMTGAADILLEHWDELDPAGRTNTLETLTRSGARLRRLLDDLLMSSRLEAGSVEFNIEELPLAPAVAEAVAAVPEGAGVIESAFPADLVVCADSSRLVQILTNLLSNAARYGEPPIVVGAREDGPVVEIRICDAGPGIPEDLEPRLFRKFSRGPGRRDRGTGLGLFIVRALARGQGGDAWYERDEAGRTCFVFSLPAPR